MDENGAQESGMDFYAQFNSLTALEKKFLKSNHQFSLAVQSPASRVSQIAKSGWLGWHDSVRLMETGGYISKISPSIPFKKSIKLSIKIHMTFLSTIFIHFGPVGTQCRD